jgi:tubulin--tyrosine ligase-like protein 12
LIACEYVAHPATLKGKKFTLRFIVVVKSVAPLEAFVYDVFWPQNALLPYATDQIDIYEKHFTVMNYTGVGMTKMTHEDFIPLFEGETGRTWEEVRTNIYSVIKGSLLAAIYGTTPSCRLLSSSQPDAVTMLGYDFILRDDLSPVLLEINFSPDCHRACKYHPSFYNDVFNTLFKGVSHQFRQL